MTAPWRGSTRDGGRLPIMRSRNQWFSAFPCSARPGILTRRTLGCRKAGWSSSRGPCQHKQLLFNPLTVCLRLENEGLLWLRRQAFDLRPPGCESAGHWM